MILELIHNVALLVVLAVGLQMLARRLDVTSTRYRLAAGILFGAVGIAGMMTPVAFAPGVIYDGRSIVISMAGLFGGPTTAILAASMAAAYRLQAGGPGALVGCAVIVEAAFFGVLLYYLRRRDEAWTRPMWLVAFGLLVHVIMLALQLFLPQGLGWEAVRQVGPAVLILYPLGFLLIARVFLEGERMRQDERALRESEGRYRSLFENNHAVMLIVAPDSGAIVDANPAACTYYGWPRETLTRMHITGINVLAPEKVRAEMERARTATNNHFHFQHRLADGTIRDVEVFSGPIRIEGRDLLYSIVHDITTRKRAEEARVESERRLSTLMDNLPGMAYRCRLDPCWTMVFMSEGALELTGYRPDELVDNAVISYVDVIHPDDRNAVDEAVHAAAACATPFEIEYRIRTRDGTEKHVWERGRVVPQDQAGNTCIEGFVMDVTARKLAVEAIRESEAKYRFLADNASDVIWVYSIPEGRYTYISPSVENIFGYSVTEALTRTVEDHIPGRHLDDLKAELLEKLDQDGSRSGETTIEFEQRKKNGETIWTEVAFSLTRDESGEPAQVMGITRDITPRKRAEERIEHLNRVLHAIRNINQLIVREQDRVALIHGACRLLVENRGYATAFIILTDEADWPVSWGQAGMDATFERIEESLRQGQLPACCLEAREIEGPLLLSDRSTTCGSCAIAYSYSDSDTLCVRLIHEGKPYGYLAVVLAHDLGLDPEEQALFAEMGNDLVYALNAISQRSARIEAERARDDMQKQLVQAQKLEAVGQLAGGVAHDFNNILQAVMGYTQMLLETAPETGELRESLDEIFKGAKRAATLTRQLLMFSRRQIMTPKPYDLNAIVENLLGMLERVIGAHIQLKWLPGKGLDLVLADAGMLEQVLMNLCVNARDAMPKGGMLTIETGQTLVDSEYCAKHVWAKPGWYVLLTVTDTGCGIDNHTLEHIFEPFFTTKPEGMGTGLGLATVYGIVKQHSGLINAYSEPDRGTVFKVYLPITGDKTAPDVKTDAISVAGGTETILLAEDDAMVRSLGVRILERAGYRVLTAQDGEEAVALFNQHAGQIALLLLDVVMPRLGGHDALQRIREVRGDVPVLFTSGYSERAIHTNFVLDEGVKLIQKPYASDVLLSAVRQVLDGQNATDKDK